jgi:hypothetical protein
MKQDLPVKPLVRQWVSDYFVFLVISLFTGVMIFICALTWNQVVYKGDYAAEYTGIINNFVVFILGGVIGAVIGVLFNIKPEDQRKAIDQSVKVSKEVGAVGMAILEDKLSESPNADDHE